ncbi:MAG: transcription elongation factor GreA [Clostridiales bacterium]|nr:transcription elongation factor GreA [Clostridiales bacterium]
MSKKIYLTQEGTRKLEAKLEHLKNVRRKEIADRIKAAIALGDLSENSEYDDAKNEQAFLEGEIITIEKTLRNAELIDENDISGDTVVLGAVVQVQDVSSGKVTEYTIIGSDEADPFKGRISNESPVGQAVMGRKIGDTVEVSAPRGAKMLKIVGIGRGK